MIPADKNRFVHEKTEQWERDLIGKEVEATMNGETWIKGTLVKIIDLFVPYVVLTETGEKGFITIRKSED